MNGKIYVVKCAIREDVWEDCYWESVYLFATDDLSIAEKYVAKYRRIHDKAEAFYIHPMQTPYWKTKETEDTPEEELEYERAQERWLKVKKHGGCYIIEMNYKPTIKQQTTK